MRKVWKTVRRGIPGCYVEWYDDLNKRRSKYFAPRFQRYVNHFIARKFSELNSDIRPPGSVVDVEWETLKKLYLQSKRADGLASKSIYGIEYTLKIFSEICQPYSSGQITPAGVSRFKAAIQQRNRPTKDPATVKKISRNSVNKYLRDLAALLHWGQKQRYIASNVQITKIRATEKPARILNDTEIRNLLAACQNDPQWRMRILLALCTGLRRSDIDGLRITDINVELKTITTTNRKTGKATNNQPLPDSLMPLLENFILEEVSAGQVRLFRYHWSKKWYSITKQAGLQGLEFHDLRRTFGSIQANAGTPIQAVQEMYGHSSIETTLKHYIRTGDSVKRSGVNKLNVTKWT